MDSIKLAYIFLNLEMCTEFNSIMYTIRYTTISILSNHEELLQ